MPFNLLNRQSLNLEQLRRQQWRNSSDSITLSQIARPVSNGEENMLSAVENQVRDWGEEKEDGAIYHVILKKVRYHTTNKVPGNDQLVSHLEWETQKRRTIKAGTMTKLIEYLVPADDEDDEIDTRFLTVFLTMHQTFCSSDKVVFLLIERFRMVKKKKLSIDFDSFSRMIVNVFLVWIENFPGDFKTDGDNSLLKQLQTFAKSELKLTHSKELLRRIEQLLDKPQLNHTCNSHVDGQSEESVPLSEMKTLFEREPVKIAEQLTLIDAELFKAVKPRECVGCVWSRRDKNENKTWSSSVKATVNQFNAVLRRVTTTILFGNGKGSPNIRGRARILEAWIAIAQECRDLKNFSSLKSILSALQSTPIFRLKKTWAEISRNHQTLFEELAALVSEDSNQHIGRELLKREGTAKHPELKKKSSLLRKSSSHRHPNNGVISGTVPYLGTFLTDLMMIDTAYPDKIDGNLINFEKRQKEFEIIAQIRLFQEAAKNYSITRDERFHQWFDSLETLNDGEYFALSCSLESGSFHKRQTSLFRSRKMKSETDLAKVGSFKGNESLESSQRGHKRQDSGSSVQSEGCLRTCGSGHIVRVSIENKNDCNMYKSVWVTEGEKTSAVIKSCLMKHNMDVKEAENYNLVQVLSNGNEVVITKEANVYYAVVANSREVALNFVLRKVKK